MCTNAALVYRIGLYKLYARVYDKMVPKGGNRKPGIQLKFKEKQNSNNNDFMSQCSLSYYVLVLLLIGLCTQYILYFTIFLHDFIHNLWNVSQLVTVVWFKCSSVCKEYAIKEHKQTVIAITHCISLNQEISFLIDAV